MSSNAPPIRSPLRLGTIEKARKSKPFIPANAIWRRLPLVVGIGAPAFFVFLLLLAPMISPIYKVSGVILIQQTRQTTLNGNSQDAITGDVAFYQRTLAQRVLDTKILSEALKRLNDEDRPKFLRGLGDSDLAIALLKAHLTAVEVDRSYLVNVDLTAKSPKGLAPTLNTILKTLLEELQREQQEQYALRLDYLQDEKTRLSTLLADERQRVIDLARSYQDTSFLRPTYTADLTKLELLQGKYYDAESDALAKEALFKTAQANQEKLAKVSMVPFAEEKEIDNLGISEIESYNYQQAQELRATVDGLTPDNPDRKSVEDRIDAMKGFLSDFKQNYKDSTIKTLSEKQNIQLESDVIKAQNAYVSAQATADTLQEQYKEAKEEVAHTSEGVFEANDVNLNLTELRDRLNLISGRLDEEELQAKSPLPVVLDQEATTPGRPASSNMAKILMLAFLASFGLVGGSCLAFDFFDQRIRCREELGAVIGGLGAEPIPALGSHGEDTEFCKRQVLRPASRTSGPLRDLALRLILEHQRGEAKIISFVGIHRRSGNTSIALNVARAISAHGFDVLLAELPTPHPGLASLLELPPITAPNSPWGNKVTDPSSAVEVIPWGSGIGTDQVRMTIDSFLTNASKAYDFVLLDLVALHTSDISREISVKSDVVVITAAQDVALYGNARDTVDWIVAGGVPAVTTVLNFASPDKFQLRVKQAASLAGRRLSEIHESFQSWSSGKESWLFSKLEKSPRYNQLIGWLQKPPHDDASKPKNDQHQ